MSEQVTTLTFFKYSSLLSRLWAFGMMQFAHKPMGEIQGLQLYKLMGSGKGAGFNPWPDWTTYAILQIWDSEASAEQYFASDLHDRYLSRASDHWTVYMKNTQAKGLWNGSNPFEASGTVGRYPLAVITRATIKWAELLRFWRYVPKSQKGLFANPGLLFTKGIGEAPFVQMATFSIWEGEETLKNFAYEGAAHARAIKLTRKHDWYKEEMFARFAIYKTRGNWPHLSETGKQSIARKTAA